MIVPMTYTVVPPMNHTASTNTTLYTNQGTWHGISVWVESPTLDLCEPFTHDLYPMHHIGNPDGKDYGETGFLMCNRCGGIAEQPTESTAE